MTETTAAGPHVAVLKGGWSAEREVSLVTGRECARALRDEGFVVTEIDVGQDIAQILVQLKPDVVFNGLHGQWGEDGCIQGLLEILQIPYTHSGVMASALAMDKIRAKEMMKSVGVPCAEDKLIAREELERGHPMEPPYVLKPVAQGSSVGVFIVEEGANRPPEDVVGDNWTLGDDLMAETYIPGRELTVSVMDNKPLAVTEILPMAGYYDYKAKYDEGGSQHVIPADIPDPVTELALQCALDAHRAIGCRGVTRTDFRYDDERNNLIALEINTQPGMTPTSLIPEQAAHTGMSFEKLCRWIVEDASCNR